MKATLSKLQKLYKLGIINYPRVDNDYHKTNNLQMFPHPPMFKYKKEFEPIEEEIEVKKAPFLYLNHLKILTPANIINFYKHYQKYIDIKKINFLNKEKEKEFEKLVKIYNELRKKNIEYSLRNFGVLYQDLFIQAREAPKTLYYMKKSKFIFLNLIKDKIQKIAGLVRNKKIENIEEVESLEEAIREERRKKEIKLKMQKGIK